MVPKAKWGPGDVSLGAPRAGTHVSPAAGGNRQATLDDTLAVVENFHPLIYFGVGEFGFDAFLFFFFFAVDPGEPF